MPTLIETIVAEAATRLPAPAVSAAPPDLTRFKSFLKAETHRLKLAHRAGTSGVDLCRARATIVDQIVRHLWDGARRTLSPQAAREFPPLAVVAVGGYGRAELNPYSDLDLMFLHEGQVVAHQTKALPHLQKVLDGVLMPLYDLNLKLGHSVRSIADCVEAANSRTDPKSMETKTSLIEARWIVGDERLFAKLQNAVLARCVEGHVDEYLAARLADQAARRTKFGNSATMQEPNVKNGCGGLRDFQNLLWMAWFKYRARSLPELEQREFITRAERQQLETAYDYLLRVRNDMHCHAERAADVLTKSLQPAVARNMGYDDASISRRLERFMREFYSHTRNIYIITRTLEQRLALLPQTDSRLRSLRSLLGKGLALATGPTAPVDGFKFVNGQILHASPRVLRDQPRRLMRVFLYAQQRGLKLHPDLAQLIRNQLDLVDDAFLRDEHVRETFLSILDHRGNVGAALRAMHETGLLAAYVPEFGKLNCLVQHEFYHQYTADEHTVHCLEQADRVWEAQAPPYSSYAPLLQGLERPFLLYLALLLHDTGKADGHGNHAEVSSELAGRVARRLALDDATTRALRCVIEHHLLPARTSQLRDMDDLAVIRGFAKKVGNVETLTLLTLHTVADATATSDKLWTGFKDALLWTLYRKTLNLLTGGTEFLRAEEKRRESQLDEVRDGLAGELDEEELLAHFTTLPPRYFHIHSAKDIADDLRMTHRFMRLQVQDSDRALEPVIVWHNYPDRACNGVRICTWDRAGLFGKISGSFSAVGLNILSAQIFTRADGVALDTFFVTDARAGLLAERDQRERFDALLTKVLTGHDLDLRSLIARQQGARPPFQSYEGEQMPTRVVFDTEASETRTVLEIETEDRIGLLYAIAQTLSELGLDISAARICTEKGAALDSFYVSELDGRQVVNETRLKVIEHHLRQAIHQLDGRK